MIRRIGFQLFLLSMFVDAGLAQSISVPTIDLTLNGTTVAVKATVSSTFQLAQVTARVEDRTTVLTDNCTTSCAWSGNISLAGLPKGTYSVMVTATDVFGNSGQGTKPFEYDRPPEVLVSSPKDSTVARPDIQLSITCSDDDPAGCVSLKVILNLPVSLDDGLCADGGNALPGFPNPYQIAAGTSSINQSHSLPALNGTIATLKIVGKDSRGQCSAFYRKIPVEGSPRLTEVHRLTSSGEIRILDVSTDRILFDAFEGGVHRVTILDRQAGSESVIYSAPEAAVKGILFPDGAIFETEPAENVTGKLFELRSGTLAQLDSGFGLGLVGNPNFAMWASVSNYWRRNLALAQTRLIEFPPASVAALRPSPSSGANAVAGPHPFYPDDYQSYYVAPNGDLVLAFEIVSGLSDIFLARAPSARLTQITNASAAANIRYYGGIVDGENIVYTKMFIAEPDFSQTKYQIVKNVSGVETALSNLRSYPNDIAATRDYQVSNDHIAYTSTVTGGVIQVYVDGVQTSFFGIHSRVDLLNPDGNVAFVASPVVGGSGTLYVASPGGFPIEVGTSLGQRYWLDGKWVAAIGRSVFNVGPGQTGTGKARRAQITSD